MLSIYNAPELCGHPKSSLSGRYDFTILPPPLNGTYSTHS